MICRRFSNRIASLQTTRRFPTSLCGRRIKERNVLQALISLISQFWQQHSGKPPTENELRHLLRQTFVEVYDFGPGQRLLREIESELITHVVADPKEAPTAWNHMESFFFQADCHGVPVTEASLRGMLSRSDLTLKSPPNYAEDIARLYEWTERNLDLLERHTALRFGPKPADTEHIPRTEELAALVAAVKSGHHLITGKPGCGKSGLIHALVEELLGGSYPAILLLAEEIPGGDWKDATRLPGLHHALDDILASWPDGTRGFLIIDALDAVRDVETQKSLRRLLHDVQHGKSGWIVAASVREFDLIYGRELREGFPGSGVAGHASDNLLWRRTFLPRWTIRASVGWAGPPPGGNWPFHRGRAQECQIGRHPSFAVLLAACGRTAGRRRGSCDVGGLE